MPYYSISTQSRELIRGKIKYVVATNKKDCMFFSDKLKDLFDKLQQQKPLEMKWGFFSKFQYTTISFEFFDSIFG